METDKPVVLSIQRLYQYLNSLSDRKNRKLYTSTKFISTKSLRGGGYQSEVRDGGIHRSIISEYIVDASGWSAAVLVSLCEVKKPARIGIGFEYEFKESKNPKNKAILFVGSQYTKSGYGWVFPTNEETIKVGIGIINPDSDISPRKQLERFINENAYSKLGLILGKDFTVNSGVIPAVEFDTRLVFGNIVRAGDSANLATPIAGEGIRMAIKYGRILGECLTEAIRSKSNSSLRMYEKRCSSELRLNYRVGLAANLRVSRYDDRKWDSSVRKISRVSENDVISLLRSEFSFYSILKIVAKNIRRKFFA